MDDVSDGIGEAAEIAGISDIGDALPDDPIGGVSEVKQRTSWVFRISAMVCRCSGT